MISENALEFLLVLRFEEGFQRARGQFAKTSSVGANIVNGPGPLNTSTRPAAFTAVTRVPKCAETAVSTMSAADAVDATAKARAPASNTGKRSFIFFLLLGR
jgi:hypothetical protein